MTRRVTMLLLAGMDPLVRATAAAVLVIASAAPAGGTVGGAGAGGDADQDGLADGDDACPVVTYDPGFAWSDCPPIDLDLDNNVHPECLARERIVQALGANSHVAFAVVRDGQVHFADAFVYAGGGQVAHDPDGVHRLFRIGSTSKSICSVAAKVLEESTVLSFTDFVSDDDGTQELTDGERRLEHLLSHQGAFSTDYGALHLFCYPGNLASFWAEPDDMISPHFDSATWGNLGGGYDYSAFNFSLAGAYMAHRAGESFEQVLQTRVFDLAGMCTATLDGSRAAASPIGGAAGVSTGPSGDVGPYINLVSPTDRLCEDNFYSSDDLPGDPYTYQVYRLDEAAADVRDPAGGVIASVVDMAHFAEALIEAYHGQSGWLSPGGIRHLWEAQVDLDGHPHAIYHPYYALGFFTDNVSEEPITQVGHAGARAGYSSAFVIRPEARLAISILVDANPIGGIDGLAKTILDDFEHHCPGDLDGSRGVQTADLLLLLAAWGTDGPGAPIAAPFDVVSAADLLGLLAAWGACP